MADSLPSVSIAIPAYNHEQHVIQALDSMLGSGVPDIELIICDDASTDRTAELIEGWKQLHEGSFTRVVLLRHPRNLGLCHTLNDIVRECRGDLIQIIASDDYFLPGGIVSKTRAMVDHPEWKISFCDGQAVGQQGELYLPSIVADAKFIPSQLTPQGMGEELLYHWSPPVHQMTWRRELYKAHGGEFEYDTTVFCEDYDSALWAAGQQILGYHSEVCQAYRYRSWPQTTNRNQIREYRDNAHVLAKNAHRFPPHVRSGYRLLSAIHFSIAIGDLAQIDSLWARHFADEAAYRQRLADPTLPPPGLDGDASSIGVIESLKHQLAELTSQLHEARVTAERESVHAKDLGNQLKAHANGIANFAELKDLLRETKATAKDRQQLIASLKSELSQAKHDLRYHGANPARALGLWWKRLRGK